MVKLIATDMDGTLLDSNKEFPHDFEEVLSNLKDKGIRLIIASGRQYYNLYNKFKKFNEKFLYISENGGVIFDDKKIIYIDEIDREKLIRPIEIVRKIKGSSAILCGEKSAYIENTEEAFMDEVKMYYDNVEVVDDLLKFIDEGRDKICKIAIFHETNAEKYVYPECKELEEDFLVCVSSKYYVDLMNIGVNKGEALKKIQEYYNIDFDQTMAFGDYLNDYELLQSCKYSYAMENAHPKLKKVSNYHTKSNDENGVMDAIRKHFNF